MSALNNFANHGHILSSPSKSIQESRNTHFFSINFSPHITRQNSLKIPSLSAKTSLVQPINAVTEDREVDSTEEISQENEKKESNGSEFVETKNSLSILLDKDRFLNAAIVLGAGTFAITKLLTIDHDYWHVSLFIIFLYSLLCYVSYQERKKGSFIHLPLEIINETLILIGFSQG